jgi:hypothetical protein
VTPYLNSRALGHITRSAPPPAVGAGRSPYSSTRAGCYLQAGWRARYRTSFGVLLFGVTCCSCSSWWGCRWRWWRGSSSGGLGRSEGRCGPGAADVRGRGGWRETTPRRHTSSIRTRPKRHRLRSCAAPLGTSPAGAPLGRPVTRPPNGVCTESPRRRKRRPRASRPQTFAPQSPAQGGDNNRF